MPLIQTENRAGKLLRVGDTQLIPIEKFTQAQPPGMWGFLLWRRPSVVVVYHPDGSDEVLPIPDVTRQAQLVLLGIGIVGSLLIWLINRTLPTLRNRD